MAHCPECDRRAYIIRALADAMVGGAAYMATGGRISPAAADPIGALLGPLVEQAALSIAGQERHPSGAAERLIRPTPAARGRIIKRKASKYQKEFGKQLKKLKKAHPRTKVQRLMKRAHVKARKVLKMTRKR